MNAFIVELQNKPGELAELAESISQKGINITAVAGSTVGGEGAVSILTNDEAGTRSALQGIGCTFREIELVSAALDDRPGTLATAARRLADAGVNIETLFATGMEGGKITVAIGVSDASAARSALGELAAIGA
jgi:hypothetical protein